MDIIKELEKPGKKRVILDTDTYNEIDDQFAVALAMVSTDKIDLACVCAAPFHNSKSDSYADGMERSYREIGIITKLVNESHGVPTPPYYRGSVERMPDVNTPVESEAAHKIAEYVNAYDGITYIATIGAITNVASAILLHPEIVDKIAILWLGANAKWFEGPEFNLSGDINASNAVFASKAPLLLFPCGGVVSELHLNIHELEYQLRGNSPLGDYLCDNVAECEPKNAVSWSRVIWDISTICAIIDTGCIWRISECPRPVINPDWSYDFTKNPDTMTHIDRIGRDHVFSILFSRLRK